MCPATIAALVVAFIVSFSAVGYGDELSDALTLLDLTVSGMPQTVQFTYVVLAWSGSPITKMFLKDTNCGPSGQPAYGEGAQYVRIQIKPNNVTTLDATPGAIPKLAARGEK